MELKFSTWQEVETYLHKSKAIVLPIGSTEQHGPNGLIGTDAKLDIPLPDNVRRYYYPGTTHGGGRGGFRVDAAPGTQPARSAAASITWSG